MNVYRKFFEAFFLLFVFILFLSVNQDSPELVQARLAAGSVLILAGLLLPETRRAFKSFFSIPGVLFLLFLAVQAGNFVMGFLKVRAREEGWAPYQNYMTGPGMWFFYFMLFFIGFAWISQRERARRLLVTFLFSSFFLSANLMPPLLQGKFGFLLENGKGFLFYPAFYRIDWMKKYVFAAWSNMNWLGDFLVLGVFSGLGLCFYAFYRIFEKKEQGNIGEPLFFLVFAAINAATIVLLQSRGALVCFLPLLIVYLAFAMAKFPSRYKAMVGGATAVFFIVILLWLGNFSGAIRELGTLSEEASGVGQSHSIQLNIEGGKRALRMFQAQPVFGVGKGNYPRVSESFADEGEQSARIYAADTTCESHYLLMLAEEGIVSVIYFLFLISFIGYAALKTLKASSRFQQLAAFSLLIPVLHVYAHGAINAIMDRFSMAALMYLLMGSLLGLLRPDFEHFPAKKFPG